MAQSRSRTRERDESEVDKDGKKALVRARAARDKAVRSIRNLNKLAEESRVNVEKRPLLKARICSLEKFVSEFEKCQELVLTALVNLDRADEFETVDALISDEMEELGGFIKMVCDGQQTTSNVIVDRAKAPHSFQTVTLPKIELPKFDGNVIEWCSFRDMFQSLVHTNHSISDIERFHYLVSCLSGPALAVVKAVPLTADNYSIAWKALHECYENQRLLATAHVDKLFAFSVIKKESTSSLSLFVNTFRENVSAIKTLGIEDVAGFLLFYLGARVLDTETKRLFEASLPLSEIPNLDSLLNFVAHRCKILENIGGSTNEKSEPLNKGFVKRVKGGPPAKPLLAATTSQNPSICLFCQHDHPLHRCFLFKKKAVDIRRKFVANNGLCFCCLKKGHSAISCPSTYSCKKCQSKHNTLLHMDSGPSTPNEMNSSQEKQVLVDSITQSSDVPIKFVGTTSAELMVVLGTAVIRVEDTAGELKPVRVLLDSGSQVSAITANCASSLGLRQSRSRIEVVGLSQQPVTQVKGVTQCTLVPFHTDKPRFNVSNIVVLSKITFAMPSDQLPASVRERYRHLVLADPKFDVPGPIDMLIGSDLYPLLLQSRADVIHSPGLPSAMNTLLGWIIVGSLQEATSSPLVSLSVTSIPTIEGLLHRFWAVEEPTVSETATTQDNQCEEWFLRTFSRDTTGRFFVGLPFRSTVCQSVERHKSQSLSNLEVQEIGSSRAMALNRLYNLERRLVKDPELYSAYRTFMDDYLALGHMRLASSTGRYYIPHHAVIKRNQNGLKVRVVFDASAKSTSGVSLNDCLITGPKLQTEISDILLRCRFHKYVFIADIAKMYRQIRVRDEDCKYQHILWRRAPDEEVCEYELCTVTYGVNASPYLAIRCLRQLDHDDGAKYPRAKRLLLTNTYVDDIVAGADSIEEVVALQKEVIALLRRGAFELKKWATNCAAILIDIPVEDRAIDPCFKPDDGQSVKVLGMHWDSFEDTFGYHVNIGQAVYTKRTILSIIARLYDPVGTLGPVVFWAKRLIQELWMDKLDWDSTIPSMIAERWRQFMDELPLLSQVSLPRHINIHNVQDVQLLGFADASMRGYAATVYLRLVDNRDNVNVCFLTCKSKVAPLKASQVNSSLTIPRLELCAVLLLARVMSHQLSVIEDIVKVSRVRAWTDSSVVLAWLTQEQRHFKIFITNRVAKIHALLPQCEWAHVKSGKNPADPASRGLFPSDLLSCSLHLRGPDFLQFSEERWPIVNLPDLTLPRLEELPDVRPNVSCALIVHDDHDAEYLMRRFSSFLRMQRVLAYCFRFLDRARNRLIEDGPVSRTELNHVLSVCLKITQRLHWPELYKQLSKPDTAIRINAFAQLAPFLDPEGVIRVGGRLKFADLREEAKHPVLLPKRAYLTHLIIWHYHLYLLHGGTRVMIALIQRRFWIVSARAAVREVIHSCVPCAKYRASSPQPFMADLPPNRVLPHHPFTNVGMDYGGPFIVKESRRRNAKTQKAYLALFVCLSTKALHLEVVDDLSTESFLACFDRFISRRGIPVEIYSDCGTNYVGAARELKTLFASSATQNVLQARAPCQWKFNPPAAPHFGGIWEAAIKSTKNHLKKVIGSQVFTLSEFTTLVVRIEGILNSRPLVPLSSDPNDLGALSPGHFLIGRPIVAIPDRDLIPIAANRLARWQLVKQAQQSFWRRWSNEYLHTLQGRQKWTKQMPNLAVGDLVIINSPGRPPMSWNLGRISEVYPGPDNIVRVVKLKTADGCLKRPVTKLVKLPI